MGNSPSNLQPLAMAPPLSDLDEPLKFETKRIQTPAPQSPLAPRPTARRVLYKLPFRLHVLPGDNPSPLERDHILDAYEMCAAPDIWQPFLQLSMEGAWIKYSNRDVDPEGGDFRIVHLQAAIKAKCIGVAMLRTEEEGIYDGVVYWKSCAVPSDLLQEELEWHIGALLAYSQIADPDGNWMTNIEIGDVIQE